MPVTISKRAPPVGCTPSMSARLAILGCLNLQFIPIRVIVVNGELSAELQGNIEKAFRRMFCCAATPGTKE